MLVDGNEVVGIEQACKDYNEWNCFVKMMYNKDRHEVYCEAFASENERIVYNNCNITSLLYKNPRYNPKATVDLVKEKIIEDRHLTEEAEQIKAEAKRILDERSAEAYKEYLAEREAFYKRCEED